jgi:formylmethanofuran dehydrogenase subunit E
MSFTDEERRAWHEEKRVREQQPNHSQQEAPAAICGHCGNPFGWSEGNPNSEFPLCDVCNGD